MMPEGNRKELEKKVDKFNPVITARVSALAAALRAYGFQGKISINLLVTVEDKYTGCQDALVERKMDLKFKPL